jgi:class 3 adenylate cyclase
MVVKIGVHTGDALHDDDDFFGATVHYAARVASHALGGDVLGPMSSTTSSPVPASASTRVAR